MIDPNQPVYLKKQVTTGSGNRYLVRKEPYLPGELPERYLTEEYCYQDGIVVFDIDIKVVNQERNIYTNPSATPTRTLKALPTETKFIPQPQEPTIDTSISSLIESDTPALTAIDELLSVAEEASELVTLLDEPVEPPTEELESDASVTEQQEQLTKPTLAKLNINTATLEEIESLPKVGAKTAKKVVALREESPFTSLEDLNSRATLAFGKSWTSLAEQIEVG